MKRFFKFLGSHSPLKKVIDLEKQTKETLHECPSCKKEVKECSKKFAYLDRYGFATESLWCTNCHLIYLNPRLTIESYSQFYDTGTYRRLISAFSGREDDHLVPQERVTQIANLLNAHLPNKAVSIFNIGGTRADYDFIKRHLNIERYICLNPGATEGGGGYELIPEGLEGFDPNGQKFDVIFLLGTLNHLSEPRLAFQKVSELMHDESVFVYDFKDPIKKMKKMNQPVGGLQFDHPTYPTIQTLQWLHTDSGLQLKAFHTENHRLYTLFAGKNVVNPVNLPSTIDEDIDLEWLSKRALKIPRKITLNALRSLLGVKA